MIESYQQRKRVEGKPTERGDRLGIVTGVYADGITVQLEGEATPSGMRYKRNLSIGFAVGQRVKLCCINGGYIVEYPFG